MDVCAMFSCDGAELGVSDVDDNVLVHGVQGRVEFGRPGAKPSSVVGLLKGGVNGIMTAARRIANCAPRCRRTGPRSGWRVPRPGPAPEPAPPYPARWREFWEPSAVI